MDFVALLPLLVSGAGLYFLIKLKFFFLLHPARTAREIFSSLKNKKSRNSLCLALAGTLGVGNVFGVCAGIMIGGAGSVLWLFVSAFFSMAIKYCECLIAHDTSGHTSGGMHRVILNAFSRFGKPLAMLYALLCTLLALFMGSALQSNAVSDVSKSAFGINPYICAFILLCLLLLGIIGGADGIERITAWLIPAATLFYILLTFAVILVNIGEIPRVCKEILSGAFSPISAGGGIAAFLASSPVREGYARGILSNEAGVGTSSLAHTRSQERTARESGLAGLLEVFFDTAVLCMLTAFAVLTSTKGVSFESPMSSITSAVADTLGKWLTAPLVMAILIFAYSTVICWYYYGTACVDFLVGERGKIPFAFAFFIFVVFGAVLRPNFLLYATDFILLLMCILTLSALMKKRERILSLSEVKKRVK